MQPSHRNWRFGVWLAWRDRRASHLRLMALVLMVTVAATSAVGFLAGRVQQALFADAQASLGGDRLIVSDRPIPKDWIEAARETGLQFTQGAQFPSMALGPTGSALVAIKAVQPAYPLKGRLQVDGDRELGEEDVYLDPSLAARLGVGLGDQIDLGASRFRVSGWIVQEPDRGIGFVNFSPRVLMRQEALAKTGLQTAGSRISYRLWVAGSAQALTRFDQLIQPRIGAGQRYETLDNARPALKETLVRAERFLSLSGMVVLLMSCVALVLAARQMAHRALPTLAVLKATGASRQCLVVYWLLKLSMTGAAGLVAGLLLGFGVSAGLASILSELLGRSLSAGAADGRLWVGPALQALVLCFGLLALFAWPAVRQVLRVSPLASLRSLQDSQLIPVHAGQSGAARRLSLVGRGLLLTVGVLALLWFGSGDLKLGLSVGLGFLALAALSSLVLVGLVTGLSRLLAARSASSWSTYALAQSLRRRRASLVLQGLGLTLALGALGLLIFLRADLVDAWGRSLPEQAPNRFVLNILPEERQAVASRLQSLGVKDLMLYPMVRGRLVGINDRTVGPDDFEDDRAKRQLDRELNLSYASELPAHNQIVRGRPLQPSQPEVSVEQTLAKSLGLQLGDRLTFDIAGESISATVSSIRSLRWDSMAVNFFMVLSPSLIQDQAQTFITSFHAPSTIAAQVDRLSAEFPSLTVVSLDSILRQLRQVLDQTGFAVQALFVFSLAAGVLILVTSLSVTKAERLREAGVLRAFGASRRQLQQAQRLELVALGALSGLAAAIWSQAMGWAVARFAFELAVSMNWITMIQLLAAGVGLAWFGGWLVLREVTRVPPVQILRQVSG
ncbi:MAG: ABC transporter permease [Burkholderiaceae bacterium]